MEIIPAIDIRGGKCVRLVQGDYGRETVFGDDPVAMALRWAEEGARRLHVVDLDGAREGRPVNDAIVRRIIHACGAPVQVAGGMTEEAIGAWAETAADRIVVGTLAVEQPEAMDRVVAAHGERIALAIDAREGRAAVRGWLETSATPAEVLIRDMASRGVRRFIYTDISRDGMLSHPDVGQAAALAELVREVTGTPAGDAPPLIHSGGVTSIEDVIALADAGVEGVIVGRALYDGRIDLRAAHRALSAGDDW